MSRSLTHVQLDRIRDPRVFGFMSRFFENYYTVRDPEAICRMTAEDFFCIGLRGEDIFRDRETFMDYTCRQMKAITQPLPYRIRDYSQYPCGRDGWSLCCRVEIRVCTQQWGRVDYNMRFSGTVAEQNGVLQLTSAHISEAAGETEPAGFPTAKLLEAGDTGMQRDLEKIIGRLVPGGVVSCFLEEGYPLALANRSCLEMAGYSSFREFCRKVEGKYLLAIHPDDRMRYAYSVKFARETGKQCECEYRICREDGTWLWVHEIGRHTRADDGREMMVSALYNISDQVARREKLEMEIGIDALTGIYNRKGAAQKIESTRDPGDPWLFFVADLDNFKRVNDFYGHRQGDQILCYIAEALQSAFWEEGTVFRLGGDEFALYFSGEFSSGKIVETLRTIADRYAALLRQVCPKAHSHLSVGGISGSGQEDFGKIYELADANLYRVKHAGKRKVFLTDLTEG